MAHYSMLAGCPSVLAALSPDRAARTANWWDETLTPGKNGGWGPILTARYCIPLFWLAGFASKDAVSLSIDLVDLYGKESTEPYSGLCAESAAFRVRAAARRKGIISLLPTQLQNLYADLFDRWLAYVEQSFANAILLDAGDIFAMMDIADASAALMECVAALEAIERGETHIHRAPFELFSAIPTFSPSKPDEEPFDMAWRWRAELAGASNSGEVWPPEPGGEELAFATALPHLTPW